MQFCNIVRALHHNSSQTKYTIHFVNPPPSLSDLEECALQAEKIELGSYQTARQEVRFFCSITIIMAPFDKGPLTNTFWWFLSHNLSNSYLTNYRRIGVPLQISVNVGVGSVHMIMMMMMMIIQP